MTQTSAAEQLLTTRDAARICNVRRETILRWVTRGKLDCSRTPGGELRFTRGQLDDALSGGVPR